jgi:hypothetical protein
MLLKKHVEKMSVPSFATMFMITQELQFLATMLMKLKPLTPFGRAVSGTAMSQEPGFYRQNPGKIFECRPDKQRNSADDVGPIRPKGSDQVGGLG